LTRATGRTVRTASACSCSRILGVLDLAVTRGPVGTIEINSAATPLVGNPGRLARPCPGHYDNRRQRIHCIRLGNYGGPAFRGIPQVNRIRRFDREARILVYRIDEHAADRSTACVVSESLSSNPHSLSSAASALERRRKCTSAQMSSGRNRDQ